MKYKLYKGVAYFPEYVDAQEVSRKIPSSRCVLYGRGWAIQYYTSGPYWPEQESTR